MAAGVPLLAADPAHHDDVCGSRTRLLRRCASTLPSKLASQTLRFFVVRAQSISGGKEAAVGYHPLTGSRFRPVEVIWLWVVLTSFGI